MNNRDERKLRFRRKNTARMLSVMRQAGVRQGELMREIGCSRWALTLWMNERHDPTDETYRAVRRAYAKFRRYPLPTKMIGALERRGVDLESAFTARQLWSWKFGGAKPQARYRAKLASLYRERVLGEVA